VSRLVIPISHQTLWATGDVRLWTDIELRLKDRVGSWSPPESFRVDTATEITTFPAYDAKRLGLPLPQTANPGVAHGQTGLEVRSGYLRFQIVGMDQTEYTLATLFLGDPDTPPNPTQPAKFPRKLLQPLALLDRLRFAADRDPAVGSLYGELIVEKR
jgi:hypothetical protein